MNAYRAGDPFVEGLGQSLLNYFEHEKFPEELLQDPVLNLLYTRVQLMKTARDKSLSDEECCALISTILDASCKRSDRQIWAQVLCSRG